MGAHGARQNGDVGNLADTALNAERVRDVPRAQIDDGQTAAGDLTASRDPLDNLQFALRVSSPGQRQADDGEVARKGEAAHKARAQCERHELIPFSDDAPEMARAG